jgi:hypothetical protein
VWTFVILLAVLAILSIVGFLHLQKRAEERAEKAQSWPTTTGRIVQNMVVNTAGRFAPVIAYSYAVGGRDYRRSRVRFGNYTNLSREEAERIAGRYPEGEPVAVRYDPDRPGMAVLEPGPARKSWKFAAWGIGGPLLLLAVIFAILAVMSGRS